MNPQIIRQITIRNLFFLLRNTGQNRPCSVGSFVLIGKGHKIITHSLKFTNWTDTGNSWARTAAMTVCNSSRLLLFTRTSSP